MKQKTIARYIVTERRSGRLAAKGSSLECARRLAEEGLLNPRAAGGSTRCLVTGDTEGFARLADIFLGGAFTAEKA